MTLMIEPVSEQEPDEPKKKGKKKRKAEQRARQLEAQRVTIPPTPPAPGSAAPAPLEAEPQPTAMLPKLQKWLQPLAAGLDADRAVTATRSSFMIAINCVMLALTAHALYRDPGPGSLWAALIPLALTNLLSLLFAVLSAQAQEKPTGLDELWTKSDGEYEAALQNKERIFATLTQELHLHGAALARGRKHLRTAYNVLLGGVVLSAVTFGLCLALGARF